MEIRVLIDTNILIQLEEIGPSGTIRPEYQELHAVIVKYKLTALHHPESVTDIENDLDFDRKRATLSRLAKYPSLEDPPKAEAGELEDLFSGIRNQNDLVDCKFLYALHKNSVAYLISEDDGVHRRATFQGLDDRVLYVREAIELFRRRFEPTSVKHPRVEEVFCYNIKIEEPIFESLKIDYPTASDTGFEPWFQKCCKDGRKAWVVRVENELAGICIHKTDEKSEHGFPLPSMKLCTFKIHEPHRGAKLGELLLRMAFEYAIKNAIKIVWITAQEKQAALIKFLKTFGFQVHGDLDGKDMIFFKEMFPPRDLDRMEALDFHIRYNPSVYDDREIQKFVIPIKPPFHEILFPEKAQQLQLPGIQIVPGNTIKKVYLCHAAVKCLPKGALIYFYRSAPAKDLITMGIVEQSQRLSGADAVLAAIGKRSVYSQSEVEQMAKKEILVIHFRFIRHFDAGVLLDVLKERKILAGPPQSIQSLPEKKYLKLKKLLALPSKERRRGKAVS